MIYRRRRYPGAPLMQVEIEAMALKGQRTGS